MNFLQACQRFCRKCSVPYSSLTTVTGQTGELLKMVEWINDAWVDIQSIHQDWDWLRTSLTPFTTTDGKATYSPTSDLSLTDFGKWDRDSFRVYNTSAGIGSEVPLEYWPYDEWRNVYQFGANRSVYSQPAVITITPNKSLGFGPITSDGYTIVGDYFKAPSEMSVDEDTPELPTQHHMIIVYRAMMFYGVNQTAPEIYDEGEKEYTRIKNRLELDRLPEIKMGGPLA